MWRVFSQIYGSSFVTQFGEVPNDIWIEELAKFSPHDVEFGIEQCKRSGSDFAPSLPRFLAYCTPPIVEDVYKQERETRERYLLPKPKASKEVREAAMAQIRKELKILATPTTSKEALEQRQATMTQAAEILRQQEVTA